MDTYSAGIYPVALIATGLLGIFLYIWGDCHRLRANVAESDAAFNRAHAHDLAVRLRLVLRTVRRLRKQRDEDYSMVEQMQECNVLLERRNHWLESRRKVIYCRWWRRRAYRSLVMAWRIGRGI